MTQDNDKTVNHQRAEKKVDVMKEMNSKKNVDVMKEMNGKKVEGARQPLKKVEGVEPVVKKIEGVVATGGIALNVRETPSMDSLILCEIGDQTKVQIDEEASSLYFYKICTAEGIEGFCMKDFVVVEQ